MFGMAIVCYLFLGGLGGGLCMITSIAGLRVPRFATMHILPVYRSFMSSAFITAMLVYILAGLVLMADSGRLEALDRLFFSPQLNYLSFGAWMLVFGMVLCFFQALMWGGRVPFKNGLVRVLLALLAVVGFLVTLYTGLFLSGMKAIALWSTPWLPVLFVLSSLSCGLVTFVVVMRVCGVSHLFDRYERLLVKRDVLVAVLEALVAVGLLMSLFFAVGETSTVKAGYTSANDLIFGPLAWVWWLGFVICGIALPLAFDAVFLRAKEASFGSASFVLLSAGCVLVGAFAMRACIIFSAARPILEMQVLT